MINSTYRRTGDRMSKRTWSSKEDNIILTLISTYGANWAYIAAHLPNRSGKQCRERYYNHLQPNIKKGDWSPEEDELIMKLQKEYGNQWVKITKNLPGRTDNAVKNRYHANMRQLELAVRNGAASGSGNAAEADAGGGSGEHCDFSRESSDSSVYFHGEHSNISDQHTDNNNNKTRRGSGSSISTVAVGSSVSMYASSGEDGGIHDAVDCSSDISTDNDEWNTSMGTVKRANSSNAGAASANTAGIFLTDDEVMRLIHSEHDHSSSRNGSSSGSGRCATASGRCTGAGTAGSKPITGLMRSDDSIGIAAACTASKNSQQSDRDTDKVPVTSEAASTDVAVPVDKHKDSLNQQQQPQQQMEEPSPMTRVLSCKMCALPSRAPSFIGRSVSEEEEWINAWDSMEVREAAAAAGSSKQREEQEQGEAAQEGKVEAVQGSDSAVGIAVQALVESQAQLQIHVKEEVSTEQTEAAAPSPAGVAAAAAAAGAATTLSGGENNSLQIEIPVLNVDHNNGDSARNTLSTHCGSTTSRRQNNAASSGYTASSALPLMSPALYSGNVSLSGTPYLLQSSISAAAVAAGHGVASASSTPTLQQGAVVTNGLVITDGHTAAAAVSKSTRAPAPVNNNSNFPPRPPVTTMSSVPPSTRSSGTAAAEGQGAVSCDPISTESDSYSSDDVDVEEEDKATYPCTGSEQAVMQQQQEEAGVFNSSTGSMTKPPVPHNKKHSLAANMHTVAVDGSTSAGIDVLAPMPLLMRLSSAHKRHDSANLDSQSGSIDSIMSPIPSQAEKRSRLGPAEEVW